jgi:alkanesulfonate monooxygenase SsuD/methylene tetrahydromethanopterin reductase-like flavin-dependent oxidoreductase (luciferase family)
MRIGIVIPTFDQYASASAFGRLVADIEDLGFDSTWFGDHARSRAKLAHVLRMKSGRWRQSRPVEYVS